MGIKILATSVAFMIGFQHFCNAEISFFRPPTGQGPQAKTLILYTHSLAPYSLSDNLELLRCQLSRVESQLESIALNSVTASQIKAADYLVVFCPQSQPNFKKEILESIATRSRPTLWIGFGAGKISLLPPFSGQFRISTFSKQALSSSVSYRGKTWTANVEPWIPALIQPKSDIKVFINLLEQSEGKPIEHPLCWKFANITFFSSIASYGTLNYLFSDLLLDFFEVKHIPPTRVYIRIEDYHCRRNHRDFRRLIDYIHSLGHPFMVAVIPTFREPATGELIEMDTQPEFVEVLRYAQQRGGRLIMHGYTHAYKNETGEGHEFWDVNLDRPIPEDSPAYARERVRTGLRQMLKQNLFPLAWETPHYAGSRNCYEEISKHFSTSIERAQLSDATFQANYDTSSITFDRYGRILIPENLGFVLSAGKAPLNRIKATGEIITQLRGTIAGCFFHPYLPPDLFAKTVESLENFRVPFFDLVEFDNWVQIPEMILLSGNAQRNITLRNATIKWKAFDGKGNLLEEQTETSLSTGERLFQRKGRGDYELFEIKEPIP